MRLLGFPGWSCTRTLERWMGCPMKVVDHFEQMSAIDGGLEAISSLIPKEKWGLVTWSMGTKIGLELSKVWSINPPQFWIALSPFLHFVGEQSANRLKDVQQLKAGLIARPESALKLFARGHGVRQVWMDQEVNLEITTKLAESLDRLCEPLEVPRVKVNLPVLVFYGKKDSLVNDWMVDEFVTKMQAIKHAPLEGVSHALFYEQPEALELAIKDHLKLE